MRPTPRPSSTTPTTTPWRCYESLDSERTRRLWAFDCHGHRLAPLPRRPALPGRHGRAALRHADPRGPEADPSRSLVRPTPVTARSSPPSTWTARCWPAPWSRPISGPSSPTAPVGSAAQLREVADLAGDLPEAADGRAPVPGRGHPGHRQEICRGGSRGARLAGGFRCGQRRARAALPGSGPRQSGNTAAAGHLTVLITGGLEVLTGRCAPLFDEIEAVDLAVDALDGLATGRLAKPPVVGEARAAWLRRRAGESGWDLPPASPMPTATPTCRCCRPSATPCSSTPTWSCSGSQEAVQVADRASGSPPRHVPRLPLAQLAGKASR